MGEMPHLYHGPHGTKFSERIAALRSSRRSTQAAAGSGVAVGVSAGITGPRTAPDALSHSRIQGNGWRPKPPCEHNGQDHARELGEHERGDPSRSDAGEGVR
jgi:hypothetical protein